MIGICLLTTLFLAVVAGPAFAAEQGLDSVVITPVSAPEDGSIIEHLESLSGFEEADWDTARDAWVVSVEDSVTFEPRDVVSGLTSQGVEVETLRLEFRSAYAKVMPGPSGRNEGFVLSPANDMTFLVVPNVNSRRLWHFLGKSVQGSDAALKLWCDVHLGAPDSSGVFAPDTVDVVKFEFAEQWD